jgi:hypothetical protein
VAVKRRAFARALRLSGVPDTGPLAEHVDRVAAPNGNTSVQPMAGSPAPDSKDDDSMSTR